MSRLFKTIAIMFLVSTSTSFLKAADPTHHFKIVKLSSVIVGDTKEIVVTAHRKDNSLIKDAIHDLTLSVTTREKSEKYPLKMTEGKASLKIKFADAGSHLIWIQDNANPKLRLSSSVKVDSKLEVLK